MKSLIKGAIIGAVAGVAAPVALSVANETLWAAKSSGSIANTRICFAQRHWYIFKPNIKHAKGCRNQLLDTIPLFLLVGVLGGSLISALALISKGSKDVDTETATPEPPAVLPPTPKAPEVVLSAPQPPVPTPPVAEVPNQPPIQSIPSGVKQSGGRLTNYEWGTIGRFSAIAGAVVVLGVGIVGVLLPNMQKTISSNTQTSVPEEADNGYCIQSKNGYEVCVKKENASCELLNLGDKHNPFNCTVNGTSKDLSNQVEHYTASGFCYPVTGEVDEYIPKPTIVCDIAKYYGLY